MSSGPFRPLRLVLAVAFASGLTWAICHGIGLGSATPYGVVVAALFIRPEFDRWPPPIFVLLPVVVPCHRVVAAGGALGGYGPGPELKVQLLALEGGWPAP